MKILVLADDDSVQSKIQNQPADLVVSCGDISDSLILYAAQLVCSSHILAVKGNHDSGGPFPSPILDLHLTVHTISGIKFGGFHGAWRYKPRGHYLYEQSEVHRLLATFPPVDIFIAHNSPRYIHDREDDVHFGFEAFNDYIARAQPKLFIHGHQHKNVETQVGATTIVGVYGQRRFDIPSDGSF